MRRIRFIAAILIGLALMPRISRAQDAPVPIDGSVPTSQPVTGVAKSPDELQAEFDLTTRQLSAIIPPWVLSNPDKRAEFAPRAIPIVYHRLDLTEQLAATKLEPPMTLMQMRSVAQALLYLLEDPRTIARINDMVSSRNPSRKLTGQIVQVHAGWLGAGDDKAKQTAAVDELEKLDRANPIDIRLTELTLTMADATRSPELETRLLHLVADVMRDIDATKLKPAIKTQLDNQAKQQQFVDKPISIVGKTIDGDDFNSANWKGKVILVDFWATWCGPCRAELPHIVQAFNEYHMKGLEIVGVSSDSAAKPLQDFLSQNNFPWTQLFDPATTKLHPICSQFQITGLPTIYIIDKQGVLRSINGWKQMDEMIPQLLAEGEATTQKAEH